MQTLKQHIEDEINYLQSLVILFEKIKFEPVSGNIKKRITLLKIKLQELNGE